VTRRLVLLRHAKSAYPTGVIDHERPLAPRGIADARMAGVWLRENLGVPDHVVVSTARRARETWALAAAELSGPPQAVIEPRVYEAWAATLLTIVGELPDEVGTVLLVGHNPGCEDLVDVLAGERDPDAARSLARKYPTSGIAVLEHDLSWARVGEGMARLTAFAVPRG
jgi:phosphohistidine phosphatase